MPNSLPADLDKSGNYMQRTRVWLGPSVGWKEIVVNPPREVTSAGTLTVQSGDCQIFVNVNDSVTVQLPMVSVWVGATFAQVFNNPLTGFERSLFIKDLGGFASAFPITINPHPGERIDKLDPMVTTFRIVQARQLIRLYPLNDLSGWFSG